MFCIPPPWIEQKAKSEDKPTDSSNFPNLMCESEEVLFLRLSILVVGVYMYSYVVCTVGLPLPLPQYLEILYDTANVHLLVI